MEPQILRVTGNPSRYGARAGRCRPDPAVPGARAPRRCARRARVLGETRRHASRRGRRRPCPSPFPRGHPAGPPGRTPRRPRGPGRGPSAGRPTGRPANRSPPGHRCGSAVRGGAVRRTSLWQRCSPANIDVATLFWAAAAGEHGCGSAVRRGAVRRTSAVRVSSAARPASGRRRCVNSPAWAKARPGTTLPW